MIFAPAGVRGITNDPKRIAESLTVQEHEKMRAKGGGESEGQRRQPSPKPFVGSDAFRAA